MTVTAPAVIRTTCRFKNTISGDVVNVYHFLVGGTSDTDDNVMDEIEANLDGMYSGLAGQLQNTNDPYDIRHDLVEMVGGVEQVIRTLGTRSWTLTSPPAASGDGLPQTDAAIINLRTVWPKTFGRKYIGTLGEGNTGNGSISGSLQTALTTFATTLITQYVGSALTYDAGVLTVKAGALLNFFAPFVGAVVNSVTGTQRRRRINRGS